MGDSEYTETAKVACYAVEGGYINTAIDPALPYGSRQQPKFQR